MSPAGGSTLRQVSLFQNERDGTRVRPFLKWAGGKSRLLPELRRCTPRNFSRYFEPFLGGGAMFFDLVPRSALLGDANPELIRCFKVVAERPEELIQHLEKLVVTEEEFYTMRAMPPENLDDVSRAGRFIYLNKTCYNGLYRVNKRGLFNTPYGRQDGIPLFQAQNIRAASRALQGAQLICCDYKILLEKARKSDFVYVDPPYMPIGKYSDFKRYTSDFFHDADHLALADALRSLHERGCFFLLSNSFQARVAEMYKDFFQITVQAPRFVNCKGKGRGKINELLIANYPIPVSQ